MSEISPRTSHPGTVFALRLSMTYLRPSRSATGKLMRRARPRLVRPPCTLDESVVAEVVGHLERCVGSVEALGHSFADEHVAAHLVWCSPTPHRPFHVLATAGVSARAMQVPGGWRQLERAELCMLLPAHWPVARMLSLANEGLGGMSHGEEADCWPLRWLKHAARHVHQLRAYAVAGRIIDAGCHDAPLTRIEAFGGLLVRPTAALPTAFERFYSDNGTPTNCYALCPVTAAEADFVQTVGYPVARAHFNAVGLPCVVDVRRETVPGIVPRKRRSLVRRGGTSRLR